MKDRGNFAPWVPKLYQSEARDAKFYVTAITTRADGSSHFSTEVK